MKGDESRTVPLSDFVALYRAYVNTLEAGYDRIRSLGSDCDSVAIMEEGDPALVRARKIIAVARGESSAEGSRHD